MGAATAHTNATLSHGEYSDALRYSKSEYYFDDCVFVHPCENRNFTRSRKFWHLMLPTENAMNSRGVL